MHVLLIHNEDRYLAGAEKMLGYYLAGAQDADSDFSVATVKDGKLDKSLPPDYRRIYISSNTRFSTMDLLVQAGSLTRAHRLTPFDLVHGWAARDWELTGLAGLLIRRPRVGTLHDHPEASFISARRRRLMRWAARWGLSKVVCVSHAVRQACERSGYPGAKLAVVHNGLPEFEVPPRPSAPHFRLGYLGVLSERKGISGLFEMLHRLGRNPELAWEIDIAGEAQEDSGQRLLAEIRARYGQEEWWSRVHWRGWLGQPVEFLRSLDLLICPSSDFDPFPTVLLEAGRAGVAVLAAAVGGVPEIVKDGETGWLFDAQNWPAGAAKLARLLSSPTVLLEAGRKSRARIATLFGNEIMVANYRKLYSSLCVHA